MFRNIKKQCQPVTEGRIIMQNMMKVLEEYEDLLAKYPDEPKSLPVFNQFFKLFLRTNTKGKPLPSIEVMAILKSQKPLVFSLMRKQSKNNLVMDMLTHVDLDYEEAKERLNQFCNSKVC